MKKTDTFALASLLAAACTALTPLHAATAEFALGTRIVLDDAGNGGVFEGKEVTRVKDEGYANRKNGMACLMSSYDPNCFNNLSVTP